MSKNKVRYSEIIPNENDWPIVKISKHKKEFIEELTHISLLNILKSKKNSLREELEITIHREKARMRNNPWKVDPPSDYNFWKDIQAKLGEINPENNTEKTEKEEELLKLIIEKYANEISGSFKKNSYKFAKRFVTFGFARLLNAARVKGLLALFSKQLDLDDKLHVVGEIDQLRELATRGTVVMIPTHFSNLDSILIGWVIQYLGLPPFMYGAGLNLFNIKLLAYFMNSLGAYKVDRRKKNLIYLETLKAYSRQAIAKGCHSLFFPGGTRSRSGQIEKSLKLGLLSTAIEAQREMYQHGQFDRKVFVVPVVINYHFTLEAPLLIKEYLRRVGKERYYVEVDEFSTSYKIATFMLKFMTKGSNISVSIGRGLDVLGNTVTLNGDSVDRNGNLIEVKDYFIRNKEITYDEQRENEYVRMLSKKVVDEYYRYNRVFASHLLAYVIFKMLERKHPKLDLYNILRLSDDDLVVDYNEVKKNFKKLRKEVERLYSEKKIDMADHMKDKAIEAIDVGLKNLGLYHDKRPLIKKKDKIIVQDTNTLYYYHNRMSGYELEKFF